MPSPLSPPLADRRPLCGAEGPYGQPGARAGARLPQGRRQVRAGGGVRRDAGDRIHQDPDCRCGEGHPGGAPGLQQDLERRHKAVDVPVLVV
jgi:hypothetical protein